MLLPLAPALEIEPAASSAELRRRQILEAARSCFSKWGFHGASMGQICAEAKMSPGALYRYFSSKETIIEAIVQEERVKASSCMDGLQGSGTLAERLADVCGAYLQYARDPQTGGLMVEICSESLRNTAVGQQFAEIEQSVIQDLRAALSAGVERGEVDAELDLDAVATVLFGLGDGIFMRLQVETDIDPRTLHPHILRVIRALLNEPAR